MEFSHTDGADSFRETADSGVEASELPTKKPTKKPVLTPLQVAMAALAAAEQEEKLFCDDVESDDLDILGYRNPVVADGDIIALYDIRRGLYWECCPTIGHDCAVKLRARHGETLCKGNEFRVVMAPTTARDKADEAAAATEHFFSTGMEARHRFALESLLNDKIIAPNFRRRIHVNAALGAGRAREKALFKASNLFSFQNTSRKWLEGTEIMKERIPVVRIMHNGNNQVRLYRCLNVRAPTHIHQHVAPPSRCGVALPVAR